MAGPKKAGRPPRHWADKARVLFWYHAVSRRSGLSDYALDKKYAVLDGLGSEDRGVFRKIRRGALLPGRGAADPASIALIANVDRDPYLRGLRAAYDWQFWDYLQKMPTSLAKAHAQLEASLKALGLRRVRVAEAEIALGNFTLSPEACYLQCLESAMRTFDEFTNLFLLSMLVREADLARNTAITELLRRHFDAAADVFFHSYLPVDDAHVYYQEAIQQVCFGAGHHLPSETSLRKRLEWQCAWPLLPSPVQ